MTNTFRPAAVAAGCLLFFLVAANPAGATDLDYWVSLSAQPVATWGDALRGLVAIMHDANTVPDFASIEPQLTVAPLLTGVVRRPPEAPLRRGTLALLTMRVLPLERGFWLRCFPNSERYALRAAAWHKLMQGEGAAEYVSGAELIAVLTRIRTRLLTPETGAVITAPAAPQLAPRVDFLTPPPPPVTDQPRVRYVMPEGVH